jgi:predicted phage tail protein
MKRHSNKPPRRIRGAGGDEPPPQHIPSISQDTLSSTALLKLIDLVSEGEIEGLVDGGKSIYLDQTPVISENGSSNFGENGVTWFERKGTQDQSYVPGFSSVENEVIINVEARFDVPVIRQITNINVNRIRVRIMIPQLYYSNNSNGDVVGTSVSCSLYIQPNGGSYTRAVQRVISGKSSSRYEVTLEAELTGDGPWNVKLARDTEDSTSDALQNKTYFASYTEVIDAKLRYPNSAYIAIKIDAKQFQSVPARAYDLKLLKVKIPSNYDPITRAYTGSWDGTFQVALDGQPSLDLLRSC